MFRGNLIKNDAQVHTLLPEHIPATQFFFSFSKNRIGELKGALSLILYNSKAQNNPHPTFLSFLWVARVYPSGRQT